MRQRSWRRYPRGTLRGTAQLGGSFGRCSGELTELSVGGAFIAGVPPLRSASHVRAHLLLPGQIAPIEVRARVLYVRPENFFSREGVGISFEDLGAEEAARVQRAVERSDLLYMRLLFHLQSGDATREEIDETCLEAGVPVGVPKDELYDRISIALRRYRGEY